MWRCFNDGGAVNSMNVKTKTLFDQAHELSRDERLELVEQLFASLEIAGDDPDSAIVPELDARWQAYERGKDPGVEAFSAIDDMCRRLKTNSPK